MNINGYYTKQSGLCHGAPLYRAFTRTTDLVMVYLQCPGYSPAWFWFDYSPTSFLWATSGCPPENSCQPYLSDIAVYKYAPDGETRIQVGHHSELSQVYSWCGNAYVGIKVSIELA